MTERLYLDDATRLTFTATVERRLVDPPRVVVDRTCFYPTGGGQPHDTGVLTAGGREWEVVDVENRGAIYHHLDGDPPEVGTTVEGRVDEARRRGHARHHTAQHLLSAVLLDEYGAETTGNQVYADRARLDCAHPRFEEADLERIERRLTDAVEADHPVRWYEIDRETAERTLDTARTRIDLLPDAISEVRIVEIGDPDAPLDRTACAGTHVERTGEIGAIEVTGRETKGPDEERVRFRVG